MDHETDAISVVERGVLVRRLLAGLMILAVGVLSGPAAFAASPTPVLGWKAAFPNGKGFGKVKPRIVYLGGDPTGYVSKLRWTRWGRAMAIGHGQGWCAGESVAQGYYCKASLHVYDLGSCHGHRAYRMISFYFKPRANRPWERGATYNACTGP
jgi:hypothetical protein